MKTKLRLEMILEHGPDAVQHELLADALNSLGTELRIGLRPEGAGSGHVPRGQYVFMVEEV